MSARSGLRTGLYRSGPFSIATSVADWAGFISRALIPKYVRDASSTPCAL